MRNVSQHKIVGPQIPTKEGPKNPPLKKRGSPNRGGPPKKRGTLLTILGIPPNKWGGPKKRGVPK